MTLGLVFVSKNINIDSADCHWGLWETEVEEVVAEVDVFVLIRQDNERFDGGD